MANRRPNSAQPVIVRRNSLKHRVISLLLTIIGVVCVAIGMKNNPDHISVISIVGFAFVVGAIGFRLIKTESKR
jgi:arginine exporter protein ArgO